MNKKGIMLSLIVKLIFVAIALTLIINIFLNKDFVDDTIDFIENLFQPPEIDPQTSTTKMLIQREIGYQYLVTWRDTFDRLNNSQEDFCYTEIESTAREFREQDLSIEFLSTTKESFTISLSHEGRPVSRPLRVNMPLCIIAEPSKSDEKIIKNFLDAFYQNNENKKTECINNPEKCALIFSEPQVIKNQYRPYDSFYAKMALNSEGISRKKRESISVHYFITQGQEQKQILESDSGKYSDEADFLLFKIGTANCILPLAKTSGACTRWAIFGGNSIVADGMGVVRRSCFYNRNMVPNDALSKIPRCETPIMDEAQAKQRIIQELNDSSNVFIFEITTKASTSGGMVNRPSNSLKFKYELQQWNVNKPKMPELRWRTVTNEDILNISHVDSNGVLPLKDELKDLIIKLRGKTREEGINILMKFNHSDLEEIKINDVTLNNFISTLRYKGEDSFLTTYSSIFN